MQIVLVGLNHKTAPVQLRECLAFTGGEGAGAVSNLRGRDTIEEVLPISTCNRVEVLLTARDPFAAVSAVKAFLAASGKISRDSFESALYEYQGEEAVRHLFRVVSSLDSMVMGEPQILGQIKEAYSAAVDSKSVGTILNRLLHKAFFVAKRVRSETGIGDHAVSVSYAAVELGRKIFGGLQDKKVLLIGAGEMAELAVEHLMRQRVGDLYVVNRTFERGVSLAKKFHGQAIRFEEIPSALKNVDIIISSTGSPDFVIVPSHVKTVMRSRRNRPLFFIDIAVPRDIDPDVNRIGNAYVYDIDDLKGVIEENKQDRKREALKAEGIIDEAVLQFRKWLAGLEAVPTIQSLRQKMEGIADEEIQRTLSALRLSEEGQAALLRMKASLITKILHHPILFLKDTGTRPDNSQTIDTVRQLFHLDEP